MGFIPFIDSNYGFQRDYFSVENHEDPHLCSYCYRPKIWLQYTESGIPVALLIEHVYVLPFNSKNAALLYVTDHYSWSDTFKFGITMLVIGWLIIILAGETYLKFLGYTPDGVFGLVDMLEGWIHQLGLFFRSLFDG